MNVDPAPRRSSHGSATVSAAIICRDEERDLPACLESLTWCDEVVVVVDTKTTDTTAQIAELAGARVFHRAWGGWSDQKNFAFAQCRGDWVLSIDADERVTAELRDEILSTVPQTSLNGFFVPRRNYWMGRWIRHGGWYPDHTLRLFRRGHGECRYMVHERIEVEGGTGVLTAPLIHDNIQAIDEHIITALRATEAEAAEMIANGMRFSPLFPVRPIVGYLRDFLNGPKTGLRAYLLAKQHFKNRVAIVWLVPFLPFAKFLHMYIWKRGFRDGWHGLWLAALSAVYVVLKYAKYWALSRARRRPS